MAAADYFTAVARNVFADTLISLGAREVIVEPLLVRYEGNGWFVELLALPEDGPRYSPRVEIGPLPKLSVLPEYNRVDIALTVRPDSLLRGYNLLWPYSDAARMREVFIRVRDEIFVPSAVPVLLDRKVLIALITARSKQLYEQRLDEIERHNDAVSRKKANAALKAMDYREYLEELGKVSPERQTNAERAWIRYARKKLT
ncbi:MAG: hypothetical protein JSR86_08945 [Proteobacteria bacterium]|nr:hypothetical protein [Pseudomonadota bacterium]